MNFELFNQQSKEAVKQYIDRLPLDKIFDVSISKKKVTRSMSQNRTYWMWLNCLSNESGNEKDFLHQYFSEKYLPYIQEEVFNQSVKRPVSTTKLDTKQFAEYLNQIQVFAGVELGCILPDPEDYHWNQFIDQYGY